MKGKMVLVGAVAFLLAMSWGFADVTEVVAALTTVVDTVDSNTQIAMEGMMFANKATGNIEKVKEWETRKAEIIAMKNGKDKDAKMMELFTAISDETKGNLEAQAVIAEENKEAAKGYLNSARKCSTIALLRDALLLVQIPLVAPQVAGAITSLNPLRDASNIKFLKYGVKRLGDLPTVVQTQIDALTVIREKTKALADANKIELAPVDSLKATDTPDEYK